VNDTLLVNLVRREQRTFLQYVRDSFPWVARDAEGALARLHAMAEAEAKAVTRLGRWLQRRRVPVPPPEPYPMDFTDWNFVALDALRPRLAEEQRKDVAALEHDLAAVTDAEARALVEQLLGVKRSHLHALEGQAVPEPVAAGH
jgi:hypothetical protein